MISLDTQIFLFFNLLGDMVWLVLIKVESVMDPYRNDASPINQNLSAQEGSFFKKFYSDILFGITYQYTIHFNT